MFLIDSCFDSVLISFISHLEIWRRNGVERTNQISIVQDAGLKNESITSHGTNLPSIVMAFWAHLVSILTFCS